MIKILISRRIGIDSFTPLNPLYLPVVCGSHFLSTEERIKTKWSMDDKGDNISEKRNSYCEFTVQYWAFKNLSLEFFGLCHYRRFLVFSRGNFKRNSLNLINGGVLNKKTSLRYGLSDPVLMESVIRKFDLIVNEDSDVTHIPTPKGFQTTVWNHWSAFAGVFFKERALSLLMAELKEKHPDKLDVALEYLRGSKLRGYNCYIAKKNVFEDLNKFQFSILFSLESKIKKEGLDEEFPRTMGYMGEILYGIFVYSKIKENAIKVKELPLVYFEVTDIPSRSRFLRLCLIILAISKVKFEKLGYHLFPIETRRRQIVKNIYYFLIKQFRK